MEQVKETVKEIMLGMQSRSPENTEKEKQSEPEFPCRICANECGPYDNGNICGSCEAKQNEKAGWIRRLGGRLACEKFKLDLFVPKFQVPQDFPSTLSLYIHGPTGTGKTHLAVAVARNSAKHWSCISVVKPMDVFRTIRAAEDAADEIEVIKEFASEKILVIDDLGVEKLSEFAVQSLYEIIDKRYMSMLGGLIVTSNLSLDGMAEKVGDDRIASRLSAMCKVIKLTGADHRLKK